MKPKILVVENDPSLQELFRSILLLLGYEVRIFDDGDAAVGEIARFKPGLAILDWDVPGLNGILLTKFIRIHRPISKMPILMITAYNQQNHRDNAFEAGVSDYLTKPFSLEDFLARVQSAFKRSQKKPPKQILADRLSR